MDELKKHDPNFPKAFYKKHHIGEEISPAYERITLSEQGQATRVKDRYPYVSTMCHDGKEEKDLLKDGWVDNPAKLQTEAA